MKAAILAFYTSHSEMHKKQVSNFSQTLTHRFDNVRKSTISYSPENLNSQLEISRNSEILSFLEFGMKAAIPAFYTSQSETPKKG